MKRYGPTRCPWDAKEDHDHTLWPWAYWVDWTDSKTVGAVWAARFVLHVKLPPPERPFSELPDVDERRDPWRMPYRHFRDIDPALRPLRVQIHAENGPKHASRRCHHGNQAPRYPNGRCKICCRLRCRTAYRLRKAARALLVA